MRRTILLVAIFCWANVGQRDSCGAEPGTSKQLSVSTDFPGGSARVLALDPDQQVVHLMPGGDPARGWACWWYARLDHLAVGRTVRVEVSGSDVATRNNGQLTTQPLARGWSQPLIAAVSWDGHTWQQSAPGVHVGQQMVYELPCLEESLWIAWGPPFTPSDTDALIAAAENSLGRPCGFELARTREGRPVRGLRISTGESPNPRPGIWIQARQHAWESGSSWVARGLVEWLTSGEKSAIWLREHAEIVVVPIMDVDNVASGDGGKEADPRDHNRDWDDRPVYPEIAAAQRELLAWSRDGRLDVFLDLHNPAPADKRPFFFVGPPELLQVTARRNRALFLALSHHTISGPLPVEAAPRVTGASYHPLWRQISGQWVNEHGTPHTMAACLETAWNTSESSAAGYQQVGRQLGLAVAKYLPVRERAASP